ncbi:hypothetical protein SAMN02983003_2468 [Devosia enhydra]|uniref:Uncharacterized protein n=2 Tax=Devosia enhydra TaxID=665118 RepID=A0A1K2I0K1_9HYPH|nr:hypothetical protein SAMN02983003_2468 [Devosia enhydra]
MLFGLAVWSGPAEAQTDDRVMNDVLLLIKEDAALAALDTECAQLLGDADIARSFAAQRERMAPWRIVSAALIGTRGTLPPGGAEAAREAGQAVFAADWARREDKPGHCRTMALALDAGVLDHPSAYPAETARLLEAHAGRLPVLDVAGSPAVAHAAEIKAMFYREEALFARCGALDPPAEPYRKAGRTWAIENSHAEILVDQILDNWGAKAPGRVAEGRRRAEAEAEAQLTGSEPAAFCAELMRAAAAGERDIAVTHYDAILRLQRDAEVIP